MTGYLRVNDVLYVRKSFGLHFAPKSESKLFLVVPAPNFLGVGVHGAGDAAAFASFIACTIPGLALVLVGPLRRARRMIGDFAIDNRSSRVDIRHYGSLAGLVKFTRQEAANE